MDDVLVMYCSYVVLNIVIVVMFLYFYPANKAQFCGCCVTL